METATMLPADIDSLYKAHADAVYRSAWRLLGRAEDAEDVLQTVFLRFLRRDASRENVAEPEYYLRRSAVNAALDLLRSRQRTASPKLSLEDLKQDPSMAGQQELRESLRAALGRLDPKWAEIFTLRYIEGLGNQEIAKLLDMSQAMVAVTLFRCRQKLQQEL